MVDFKNRLAEFIDKHGEKGYMVLKAIIEVTEEYSLTHKGRLGLGDFDFRGIRSWLMRRGLDYNPTLLLRSLERDYGVIETSYRSSNQRWWRIVDKEAILRALEMFEGESSQAQSDDPELQLIRLQLSTIDVNKLKRVLQNLAAKDRLNEYDLELFREMVFTEMEYVVKLIKKMSAYQDMFSSHIEALEEILHLATLVAAKMERRGASPIPSGNISKYVISGQLGGLTSRDQ